MPSCVSPITFSGQSDHTNTAAGNSGPGNNTVLYPAKYQEVIAVSATDSSNMIAGWSSRGPEVELAAPGVGINSTYKGGGYKLLSGTSMASPHVAGTAALVIASGITNSNEVRQKLQTTADDLGTSGRDNLYGYGLVDAEQAATGVETTP
ncbi:MAG: S8 family serine peptidase [Bacillota bacterium]|nr:S8 family serine peptidase [Bacillota bacterium]